MSKTGQNPDPWISKRLFDSLHDRCADAEDCLKRLLCLIDPDVLTRHAGDWKAATAEILQENQL
jgi:hypothetical protein